MRALTMCRGFHSVDVIRGVNGTSVSIVMSVVKLPRIKERIREYDVGERGAVSEYVTTSASDQTTSYKLVIVRRRKRTEGDTKEARTLAKLHEEVRVADKYHVFATTMPDSRIDNDPLKVA